MGIDDLRIEFVSPEPTPLAIFGRVASNAVAELLEEANIDFRGESYARATPKRQLELVPGGELLNAERVVTLPTLEGPRLVGVPTDEHGFIVVDDHGRVRDVPDVYAAGDGTTFPIKQGGIACQLADAIAEQLAARAGADLEPQPFHPVLRGRLLTDQGAHYLEHTLPGGVGADPLPELQRWSAPHKVHGRYLSPWLEELDHTPTAREPAQRTEPGTSSLARRRMELDLDPYSPLS